VALTKLLARPGDKRVQVRAVSSRVADLAKTLGRLLDAVVLGRRLSFTEIGECPSHSGRRVLEATARP